jgi:hypothetical protein
VVFVLRCGGFDFGEMEERGEERGRRRERKKKRGDLRS